MKHKIMDSTNRSSRPSNVSSTIENLSPIPASDRLYKFKAPQLDTIAKSFMRAARTTYFIRLKT